MAAAELGRRAEGIAGTAARHRSPEAALGAAVHGYVAWALGHPVRFTLVYGPWSSGSEELATDGQRHPDATRRGGGGRAAVRRPARRGQRTDDALILALAHGAVDLALAGTLSRTGKGRAAPADLVDDLVDDLLAHLRYSAERRSR